MRRIFIAFAVALLALPVFSAVVSCAPKYAKSSASGVYHTVQPGQNLYRIALTYEVPIEVLIEANRISDPGQIKTGQRIFVPGARARLSVPVIRPRPAAVSSLPLAGQITSYFGSPRGRHYHSGIDISAPRGSPIRAAQTGRVIFSGRLSDYGNTIKIQHDRGLVSLYGHNERNLVRPGQVVKKGQRIATVGRSGRASGYHLHFEVRRNGKPVDPLTVLPF